MLSNAYFLAKFRFDTAENEPAKNLQNFVKFANFADPNPLTLTLTEPARAPHGARARPLRAPAADRRVGHTTARRRRDKVVAIFFDKFRSFYISSLVLGTSERL